MPLPIHGDVRHPLSARKFGLCREKRAVGSRCPWSNMFSANRSAFAGCSLPLLVMYRKVEGLAGAGVGARRSHPLQIRSHPSPAPGDNSGALGTVCRCASGEGALDRPSSSCLSSAELELTKLRAGRAWEEAEGQEQSWAGAAGGAVGQGSLEERRNGCGGKGREGIDQRWKVMTSLSMNLVKIKTEPLHTVQGQTLPVVLPHTSRSHGSAVDRPSYILTLPPGHRPP